MQKSNFSAFLVPLLLGAILAVLAVLVFQLNTREERIIQQGNQIRELGASADRLRAEVQQLRGLIQSGAAAAPAAPAGPAPTAAASPSEKGQGQWLHPEVENFLKPNDFALTLPEAGRDGILIRHYGTDPKGFNVMTENAADLSDLIWHYCGISLADRMNWTDPDRWFGQAAERVEITNDGKEFTVYLKKGIPWHKPGNLDLDDPKYAWLQGDHYLTARDVKFSLDILLNPQVENGALKNYYEDLDSWEVIDDYTIVIRWKKKLYLSVASTLSFPILPEFFYAYDEDGTRFPPETIGLKFNQHWHNHRGLVGAGPYRLVHYEPGVEIRLERNEEYYGEQPAIQRLIYPIYANPDLTLMRLKAREETFGGLRPSQYRDEIKQWESVPEAQRPKNSPFLNGDILHKKYIGMAFSYLGWNAEKALFKDKRVRRAMTMALNRQGIIDTVFEGLGRVATGDIFALSAYNDPDIKPWPFDLDQARALLREAGWEDTDGDGLLDKDLNPEDADPNRAPFEFRLLIYDSSPEYAALANIYKDDLLKIGVKMSVEAAEWSLMQKKMDEKDFDCYTGGWALDWDPDLFQLWHSSQADIPKGSNYVGFRNPEADRIIETLRETFDRDERIRLLRQFQRILHEEQPYTFFRVPESVACWWKEVKRVEFAINRPHASSLPWWVQTSP